MERILIAAGARKRTTHTRYQTRLLCPNKQQISFSLVHPMIDEKCVGRICKRFGMRPSTFERLYDETNQRTGPSG
ncbi:MAG: hypothetical protein OXJ90_08785 [Spirochaetaceae bacterium]|nr:hypothetical protein [Spirochaetaceae bacterium]